MTEPQAKKPLRRMLLALTPGSILHDLSNVYHDKAERAGRQGDERRRQQCQSAATALFVMGLGLDAACPR
jgi:hypothetical protein